MRLRLFKKLSKNICNNFEYLIVIDDDSKDETKNILNNLDIDVIYHKNSKNLGAGKSLKLV
jgi:glycosyltransferase involved in cell wall biosynthesis